MKINKLTLALAATIFALSALFTSCSDDSDSAKSFVELPPSVGENPFVGKTWKENSVGEDVTTITFKKNTYVIGDSYKRREYLYSYDAEKGLLYAAVNALLDKDGNSVMSVIDYYEKEIAEIKKMYKELPDSVFNQVFSSFEISHYTIDGDSSLTLKGNYFDGTLSGSTEFEGELLSFTGSFHYEVTEGGKKYEYTIIPVFNETLSTFTGYVYKELDNEDDEDKELTYLGTAEGTVTLSGTGFGQKLTVKFTNLPEGLPEIEVNKDYTLNQEEYIESIYTLVE